jgi:predicted XRE-type DNA-binding protein
MKRNKRSYPDKRDASTALDRVTKHELAAAINVELQEQGLSQPAAAAALDMPQPNISALANYRLEGFSIQRLIRILKRLGKDVTIQVERTRRPGKIGKTSVSAA